MDFTSQVCTTIEQSKRLLALGLKRETADMAYQNYRGHCIGFGYDKYPKCITDLNILRDVDIPAWSLHRLIEMYTKHYVCEHINLKLLTYDTIIENIRLDILTGTFNKEYLE